MSEYAQEKKSFLKELKSLTPKQVIAIVVSIAAAVALEVFGFGTQCWGFLIVAVVLYMGPHLTGVMSPKVKVVVGAAFLVVALPIGTFVYADAADQFTDDIDDDTKYIKDVVFDESTGVLTATFTDSGVAEVKYGLVDSIAFGSLMIQSDLAKDTFSMTGNTGTVTLNMDAGKLYFVSILLDRAGEDAGKSFVIDTGISDSDKTMLSFTGALYLVAYALVIFFFILITTTMMRRSAEKARKKMEAQGRLYPQGYGRCKNCGGMVLPGEVTCRKCGTYIDVPDEMRARKKDYFACESCGAEVPADAKVCPRCGVSFEDDVETEITHEDGTVDTSTETFECSECGAEVPANAKRCPKCGIEFEE